MGFIGERFYRYELLQDESADNGFFYNYLKSEDVKIPPLSIGTFFGVGMLSGISGNGYHVNVDGGFLRFYSAFGLPTTILYYFPIMLLLSIPTGLLTGYLATEVIKRIQKNFGKDL